MQYVKKKKVSDVAQFILYRDPAAQLRYKSTAKMVTRKLKLLNFFLTAGVFCTVGVSALLDSHYRKHPNYHDSSYSDGYALEIDPIWGGEAKSPVMLYGATIGTKPNPANGASAPTNSSYTSTTGRPFDFFTGISYRQLDIARKQLANIFRLAARAANVSESIGREVFGKVDGYILTLWFPEDAARLGYPNLTPAATTGDGGGPLPSYDTYWTSGQADQVSRQYGRYLGRLLYHMLFFDSVGYSRVEDDYGYTNYIRFLNFGSNLGDAATIFLHETIHQLAASEYFLGGGLTEEVYSALKSVFRFLNWHAAVEVNLYQFGIYSRYQGPAFDACAAIPTSQLVPAEQDVPLLVNGYQKLKYKNGTYKYDYDYKYGPVYPDGSPRPKEFATMGRADTNMTSDDTSVAKSQIIPQPPANPNATSLSPPPYSANVGREVDRVTGMSNEQLAVALTAWSCLKAAAAKAAGVTADQGAKIFDKQAAYTYLLWHWEYASGSVNTYYSPDDVWTNVTLDSYFASDAADLDYIVLGLTQRNGAAAVRVIDKIALNMASLSRMRGESWFTLAYFAFTTDSYVEAASFFLGDALTDETYSALESLFTFINFKTYQIYHSYNNRYRFRPFADNWEMIGVVPTTCSTIDVDFDGYDVCSYRDDNYHRPGGYDRHSYGREKYHRDNDYPVRRRPDSYRDSDAYRGDQYRRPGRPDQDHYDELQGPRPDYFGRPHDFQDDMRTK